jgi:hypothetical protein
MKLLFLYTSLLMGMFILLTGCGNKHATKAKHHRTGKVDKNCGCHFAKFVKQ